MYLSPRSALNSLASTLLAGLRGRIGSGITPGTGEPVGSLVGSVCRRPSRTPITAHGGRQLNRSDGSSVARDETVRGDRRSACRRAVLCAKSLRRSAEVTLWTPHCTPGSTQPPPLALAAAPRAVEEPYGWPHRR